MSKKKFKNFHRIMRAKLSFDDGFAERPIYCIKANVKEKTKGINMRELIKDHFNITSKDEQDYFNQRLKQWDDDSIIPTEVPESLRDKQVKFTRDEKGNIVSPFRSKKKLK